MNEDIFDDDIDYGNMDDLPISDHIEWRFDLTEAAAERDDFQQDWLFV
jgi:hypothetical protein